MNAVKVISPGALATVQDADRFGFLQSGISVSGIMDSYSHRATSLLVDNPQEEAVLEVTLMGPVLEFQCSTRIAMTGAMMQSRLNDQPVPMWQAIPVGRGDRLSFSGIQGGCRAYITFAGGLDVPAIMGSKPTNLKAQMGGFEGRMLKRGDVVPLKAPSGEARLWAADEEWIPKFPTQITLQVVLGPQEDLFTKGGIASFLNTECLVTPANDRMGYRLEGEEITHKAGADIVSDGIVMDAVQVPSSGQPIILMVDRQTTGRYTEVVTVVAADLPLLARAQASIKIRFERVGVEEAQQLLYGFHERLQAFARTRRPVNGWRVPPRCRKEGQSMNSAVVLSPGLFTTIQDTGRFGFLESGISPAGVMDDYSFRAANLLVGNVPDEAVLEATLIGSSLRFQDRCLIVVIGGEAKMKINGHAFSMWQSVLVNVGDVLSFAPMRRGCRLYIVFAGGITVLGDLGSKSTCCKAQVGGLYGRPLRTGDELPLAEGVNTAALAAHTELVPDFPVQVFFRVVLGPQENAFTLQGIRIFLSGDYTATPVSDRMGYRLEGPQIEQNAGADIISNGIATGAVQVPAGGQPTIIMAGRQTIGGYTRIATAITADLLLLAQARPGDTTRFRAVSVEEAQEELLAYRKKIENFKENMLPVQDAQMQLSVNDVMRLMREFQSSRIGVLRLSNQQGELYLEKSSPEKSGGTKTAAIPQGGYRNPAQDSVVISPLVGMFYVSAAPDQSPFIQVGTTVKKGDPLSVIESMKIMNEIVSERDGVITEIMAQNEQAVKFGQPVLRMK